MLRTDLLVALTTCKDALSKNTIIPILSHYCIDNEKIVAFNGVQGVVVYMNTSLELVVPGNLFLNLIKSGKTPEIKIEKSNNTVTVIDGRSKSSLVSLNKNCSIFTIPEYTELQSIAVSEDFIAGIKMCLTTTADVSYGEHKPGVLLTQNALYSTDDVRVSKYILEQSIYVEKPYLLPKKFCEMLVSFSKNKVEAKLYFGEDFVIVDFLNNTPKVLLFSKVEPITDISGSYENLIAKYVSQDTLFFKIPEDLQEKVSRCGIFLSDQFSSFTVSCNTNELVLQAMGTGGSHIESSEIFCSTKTSNFKVAYQYFEPLIKNIQEMSLVEVDKRRIIVGRTQKYVQLVETIA